MDPNIPATQSLIGDEFPTSVSGHFKCPLLIPKIILDWPLFDPASFLIPITPGNFFRTSTHPLCSGYSDLITRPAVIDRRGFFHFGFMTYANSSSGSARLRLFPMPTLRYWSRHPHCLLAHSWKYFSSILEPIEIFLRNLSNPRNPLLTTSLLSSNPHENLY